MFARYLFPALGLTLACTVLAKAQTNYAQEWQLALIEAEDGDTLRLPTGTYRLTESLLVDGIADLVIIGAGREATILDFSGQEAGAEGLKVSNCDRVTLRDFTILNTAGDAIKAQACEGITFRQVETSWTGEPKVLCENPNGVWIFCYISTGKPEGALVREVQPPQARRNGGSASSPSITPRGPVPVVAPRRRPLPRRYPCGNH